LSKTLGKPYNDAYGTDVEEAYKTIKYYAGFSDKIHGQVIEPTGEKLAYTLREPMGVCGLIVP